MNTYTFLCVPVTLQGTSVLAVAVRNDQAPRQTASVRRKGLFWFTVPHVITSNMVGKHGSQEVEVRL